MQAISAVDYENERIFFCGLYKVVVGEECNPGEFDADDLYAIEVTERALHTGSGELRNLAAHLQARRHTAVETITLQPTERLEQTWRLSTLPQPKETQGPASPIGGAAPAANERRQERRGNMQRFTLQEIQALSVLHRLYRQQFNRAIDVVLFATSDSYGRRILGEALASDNPELTAAAMCFLDPQGRPHRHRRDT
jgi:hypothetical protein